MPRISCVALASKNTTNRSYESRFYFKSNYRTNYNCMYISFKYTNTNMLPRQNPWRHGDVITLTSWRPDDVTRFWRVFCTHMSTIWRNTVHVRLRFTKYKMLMMCFLIQCNCTVLPVFLTSIVGEWIRTVKKSAGQLDNEPEPETEVVEMTFEYFTQLLQPLSARLPLVSWVPVVVTQDNSSILPERAWTFPCYFCILRHVSGAKCGNNTGKSNHWICNKIRMQTRLGNPHKTALRSMWRAMQSFAVGLIFVKC